MAELLGRIAEAEARWQRLAALIVGVSDRVRDTHLVRLESQLIDDIGLSSLMVVNLMIDLEREFNIVIREEDFDHLRTVGDVLHVIESRKLEG